MSKSECSSSPTNLVERGIRRRHALGVSWLVAGIVASIVLIAMHAAREWRILLVVPFAISANGFLQAREKTCVILAALGKRETNDGRSYADVGAEERAILRRRALGIGVKAFAIAAVVTAVVYVV